MKINRILLSILLFTLSSVLASTDNIKIKKQSTEQRHSIGSSVFLLGNFAPGKPPYYFIFNYGYKLTNKDIIIVEAKTWTYYEPLGTYGSSDELYKGKIRTYGVGVGYQHFLWKNMYSTVKATPFLQQFFDVQNKKIQNGFQLYLQFILGYRFEFLNKRWFIEPSVAFNYWPINTNFPASFKRVEKGTPNYFLFEPGLHFGYKF